MCEPVSATLMAVSAMSMMAMGSSSPPSAPPPYVPPAPPPPPPAMPVAALMPEAAGALSLGTKSPHETKMKARQRRQRYLPPNAFAGLNIPAAPDGMSGGI